MITSWSAEREVVVLYRNDVKKDQVEQPENSSIVLYEGLVRYNRPPVGTGMAMLDANVYVQLLEVPHHGICSAGTVARWKIPTLLCIYDIPRPNN